MLKALCYNVNTISFYYKRHCLATQNSKNALMQHLIYDYTDLIQLQEYYDTQIVKGQKVIIQLHTGEESIVNEVYSLLMQEGRELKIIPVLQQNVKTRLYFTIYPYNVTIAAKENFLEHDLYKAIIDSTKEGFWLLDEELNIISINHSFANMLGYEKSELLGRKPYELLALVNEQQQLCAAQAETINILINLINNAREAIAAHTKSGAIKIKAYTDGLNIKVTVQDNGEGIRKKDIEQIFEPYFTTKHQTQGTGLGLYMSHQIIVNNMNGSIYAENREDGTCFYITLPKGDQKAEEVEQSV